MLPKNDLRHSFPSSPPPAPSPDDVESFCHAARDGDKPAVEKYLDQFGAAIVNAQDTINARAITWAAFSGHDEVVKLLLDRGADINAHGTNGKPALTWAAEMGKVEVAALLLDRGASLEERDDTGTTPLEAAQRSSYQPINDLFTQWTDDRARELREAEQRKVLKEEQEARAAVAERLRKLKEGAGKLKIVPESKRGNKGPRR